MMDCIVGSIASNKTVNNKATKKKCHVVGQLRFHYALAACGKGNPDDECERRSVC